MKPSGVAEATWRRLSEIIEETMGLHFPSERWSDLQRGMVGAASELGFGEVAACIDCLLAAPLSKAQLQALASHLTVGETYFFREQKTFDALAGSILPELIHGRRRREQSLRIWSAACCTGEEAYSLAILVHQLIPDLKDWRVTILATDINGRFLQKAVAGVYGEWSFRETPDAFKERYFQRAANGRYAIRPEIKKLVTFASLNLAEHVFPSVTTQTNAMDLIFCRNVLMYFTPLQARKVVDHLQNALVEGGWLVVSPSEASQTMFSRFVPVNFPGAILYRKKAVPEPSRPSWIPLSDEPMGFFAPPLEAISRWMPLPPTAPLFETPPALPTEQALAGPPPTPCVLATELYQQGRYAEAADTLLASLAPHASPDPQTYSILARALANQGKLTEAQAWCDRWIAHDKLDSSGHYLRAVILQELGDHEQARRSLQRAIYLQPGHVLAHFTLANLARNNGDDAGKHFANALDLLRDCPPDELLPESDGLTAGRLMEIITSLVALESTP
ncbi:MAG: methyltransferase, CheR-type [Verrucomicrobiales bacterium]|nr:methyltransferase, CheR-type [Verrucomicrobiales bacterium]